MGDIQELHALGISTDEKKRRKIKILRLGVWKARGLRKDGFGLYLAMKWKKVKSFRLSARTSLTLQFLAPHPLRGKVIES